MKFKLALVTILLVAAALALAFYRPDARFEVFITEFDEVTDAIVFELGDDLTSAGVARAQKILDAKKNDLKEKLAELKAVPASQMNDAKLARLQDSIRANRAKIRRVFAGPDMKRAVEEDPQFLLNVKLLVEDYTSLIE